MSFYYFYVVYDLIRKYLIIKCRPYSEVINWFLKTM